VPQLPPAVGGWTSDGSIPQLAGQHSSVLIKQMADIRAGLRHNPTMYPFAAVLTDPQDLADLAAYLEGLCIPVEHGRTMLRTQFSKWRTAERFTKRSAGPATGRAVKAPGTSAIR
jgi:hypothetical protein